VPTDPSVFDNHLDSWEAYLATPWARVRYDVVGRILDETLAGLGAGPHPVLDLGGGDGVDSVRLAAAGHEVTIVDSSAGMLDRAAAVTDRDGVKSRVRTIEADLVGWEPDGPYDLVLCHFVLQYLPADRPALDVLRRAVRPGGAVSVICPNPVGDVMMAVRHDGDPALALRRLRGEPRRTVTFDHEVRPTPRVDTERGLVDAGFAVWRRVGLRAAVDLLPDGPSKDEPAGYPAILALERELAERAPYLDVARAWQLVAS